MQTNYSSEENPSPFYSLLSKAKAIHKLQEAIPLSIFPLIQNKSNLCKDYDQQHIQQSQNFYLENNISKIHKTKEELRDIFRQYLYCSNQNYANNDNLTFGQMHINKINVSNKKIYSFPVNVQKQLRFESRFQSGNLFMAAKGEQNEYNLVLQKDINSKGCTQWFYFQICNNKLSGKVKINILNFMKDYSAYQNGMKICVYSVKKYQKFKLGWHRSCEDIQYRKNTISCELYPYYTLSFTYNFQFLNDQVYFAYSYPYTYSKLQKFLQKFQTQNQKFVTRKRIAITPAGNHIQMLTITNNYKILKPTIFITARVHPGQSISSYICQGFLEFIVKNQNAALLNQFVFKVIPMLNPDGVIHGNYRCSLNGVDLNRCWKKPDRIKTPQVFYTKQMIKQCKGERLLFIDLHGHSKKKGVFMYGCQKKDNPYQSKEFPYLMSKKLEFFNYFFCNFTVKKNLYGTGRVSVWRQLNITYSYTLETSFFGPSKQRRNFLLKDYKNIGRQLLNCIFLYFYKKRFYKLDSQTNQIKNIINQLYQNQQLLNIGDNQSQYSSDYEQLNDEKNEEQKSQEISIQKPRKIKLIPIPKLNSMQQIKVKKQITHNKSLIVQSKITKIILDKPQQNRLQTPINLFSNVGFGGGYRPQKIVSYSKIRQVKRFQDQPNITLKYVTPKKQSNFNNIIFPSSDRQSYTNYQKARKYRQGIKIFIQKDQQTNVNDYPDKLNIKNVAKKLSLQLKNIRNKNY